MTTAPSTKFTREPSRSTGVDGFTMTGGEALVVQGLIHRTTRDLDYLTTPEHGFQKPDPRTFTAALDLVEADTDDALMLGDWAPSDGAAAALGIDTLILPMPADGAVSHRGLDAVLRLVG